MNTPATYIIIFAVVMVNSGCTDSMSAVDQHISMHQHDLVEEAEKTIEMFGNDERLKPSDLPNALQLPNLRYAETFPTHINLVTYQNPDTVSGYRVWIKGPDDKYLDRPTAVPSVTRYRYCDDYEISPENRP